MATHHKKHEKLAKNFISNRDLTAICDSTELY